MGKVILGIHGLGNKPEKSRIAEWWRLSMEEGLKREGFDTRLPRFEIVYWADIMNKKPLVNFNDPDGPLYVDEIYTKAPENFLNENYPLRKRLLRTAGKYLNRIFLNEDLTMRYSFIPNYLVRRYFRDIEIYYREECEVEDAGICMIKDLIKLRLVTALEKYSNDDVMLIAHSMGSIVAFDVLSFVVPGIKIDTFITIGSPLGLPLVVSKIASQYKPNPRGKKNMVTPPGICCNWYNFSDVLDRVTFNYKLARRFKMNNNAVKPRDFGVVNDYHNQKGVHNPHKSYGYLRAKQFARVLNEFILR